MIERFHRSLKAAIKASSGNWEEVLPLFLLGLRAVVREDLKSSSAEMQILKSYVLYDESKSSKTKKFEFFSV